MGGIRVDAGMRTSVPNLYAAGEAVGGANGANRLSGNAITEALTFGRRAGLRAATLASTISMPSLQPPPRHSPNPPKLNPAAEIVRLQAMMNEHVGALRTRTGLAHALKFIGELSTAVGELPAPRTGLDAEWMDLHDLHNMRLVAECVTRAALERTESRGAHQREDFSQTEPEWQRHQALRLFGEELRVES